MQEETTEKTISLCVRTANMTAGLLKSAMRGCLADMKRKQEKKEQKKGRGSPEGRRSQQSGKQKKQGKQTLKQMMKEGSQLTNIEITDKNIKSFDRVARKYGIDYSLKKDSSTDPPRYLVFFRAKDVDVMKAAFKEYAGISTKKRNAPAMSIRKKLQLAKDRVAKHRELEKEKQKDRGQER